MTSGAVHGRARPCTASTSSRGYKRGTPSYPRCRTHKQSHHHTPRPPSASLLRGELERARSSHGGRNPMSLAEHLRSFSAAENDTRERGAVRRSPSCPSPGSRAAPQPPSSTSSGAPPRPNHAVAVAVCGSRPRRRFHPPRPRWDSANPLPHSPWSLDHSLAGAVLPRGHRGRHRRRLVAAAPPFPGPLSTFPERGAASWFRRRRRNPSPASQSPALRPPPPSAVCVHARVGRKERGRRREGERR